MKAHRTNFEKGSMAFNIIDIALPITFAQFLNLLYSIVDRIYIGRIKDVGTNALSGIGICFPIITMVIAFSMLFGTSGGAPLCSMKQGEGDLEEASKIMGTSFSLLLYTGFILTILGLIFYKPILYFFGASDITFFYARQYIIIYLLGSTFVLISLGMNSFINSQGFGRVGMITIAIGAILNIVLDPIFIFTFSLGIRGAAIATVISQFVSMVWVVRFLRGKQVVIRLSRKDMKLEWVRVKKITVLGFAGFTAAFTNSLVQIVCNKNAFIHGGDIYVAVFTILNSIREVFQTPVNGFSNGAIPVISYNYGKKDYERVKKGVNFLACITIIFGICVWIVLFVFPGFFVRLFSSDGEIYQYGIQAMYVYFFGFFLMSLQISGQCTFVALGKSKHAIFFSIFRKVIIVVPLTYILPYIMNLGIVGVFLAEPISNLIGGLACFITMRITLKKTCEVFQL